VPINGFSSEWVDWLGQDTINQFKQYGYYSFPMKLQDGTVLENTKVIGLNSQPCNNMNWFLWADRYDPGQQIEWLQNELEALDQVNGKAIIITHIPFY